MNASFMFKLTKGLRPIILLSVFLIMTVVPCSCGGSSTQSFNTAAPTQAADPTGSESTPKPNRFPNRPNADQKTGSAKELAKGDVAPEFSVKLIDGTTFRMSDHDDGVVLLNFWATWCGPCVKEMPDLQKLSNDGIAHFTVCCLSVDDSASDVKTFCQKNSYKESLFGMVSGTAIGSYYPSDYIPYTLLIKDGIVQEIFVGSRSYADYRKAVDAVMGK